MISIHAPADCGAYASAIDRVKARCAGISPKGEITITFESKGYGGYIGVRVAGGRHPVVDKIVSDYQDSAQAILDGESSALSQDSMRAAARAEGVCDALAQGGDSCCGATVTVGTRCVSHQKD